MPTLDPTFLTDPLAPLPQAIQGLIFDVDGTLIDTMSVHYRAWQRALEGTGAVLSVDKFYGLAGMPTHQIAELLKREQELDFDAAAATHRKEEFFIAGIPGVRPVQPAIDLAQRENGRRKISVASGGTRKVVQLELQAIHIAELFPICVTSDDVTRGKPAPDTFLEAAKRMGVRPEQCVVYEDAVFGFEAARAAGMQVVDVRPWYTPAP